MDCLKNYDIFACARDIHSRGAAPRFQNKRRVALNVQLIRQAYTVYL